MEKTEYDILVNKENPLDRLYVPKNLVEVQSRIKIYINPNYKLTLEHTTYESFRELQSEALRNGYDVEISSGYRSFDYQQEVLEHTIKQIGEEAYFKVALPGCSEHQTGLAIDYWLYREKRRVDMTLEEIIAFEKLRDESNEWIAKNAYNYGFILRFPTAPSGRPDEVHPITKMKSEPWHLRYVGLDIAQEIYNEGKPLVLEEYKKLIKERSKLHI